MKVFLSYSKTIQVYYVYIAIINLITFTLMGIDKYRARKNIWRIQEYIFLITALMGGSIGVLFGMLIYKHKINKKKFRVGVPIIYIFNVIMRHLITYMVNVN